MTRARPPTIVTELIKDRIREVLPDPVPRAAEANTGSFPAIPDGPSAGNGASAGNRASGGNGVSGGNGAGAGNTASAADVADRR